MRQRQTALLLLAALALNGCSPNWQPIALPQPKPLEPRTIIEFHVGETLVRLHGVQFAHDSVTGIPWLDHLSCDTCRVAFPLARMTGIRTGNPGAGAWWLIAPLAVVAGFSVLLVIALGGYHGD